MDDMRSLAEEFINELRELVQPAPKKKKLHIGRLLALVAGLAVAAAVALVARECRKVPSFDPLDD